MKLRPATQSDANDVGRACDLLKTEQPTMIPASIPPSLRALWRPLVGVGVIPKEDIDPDDAKWATPLPQHLAITVASLALRMMATKRLSTSPGEEDAAIYGRTRPATREEIDWAKGVVVQWAAFLDCHPDYIAEAMK